MKTYIMRWNPGISSAKLFDYNAARDKWPGGFRGDWSIYEWEDAHVGDEYYMVRVGDGPCGVVYVGHIMSEPYVGKDWAGDPNKQRHYVDITIEQPGDPDEPMITIEQLEVLIPEIEWRHGHSGVLLTPDQAEKLHETFPIE